MRSIGANDRWQVGNLVQRLYVVRYAAKRSLEGIDCRSGNPVHVKVMCWPDQHDTRDGLRTLAKRCECRGSDAARIDIARVRCNQGFGSDVRRRLDIGEELQNLRPQPIRIARVELARHRRRPGRHVLQTGLHLSRFRLTTILDMLLKLRPSAR